MAYLDPGTGSLIVQLIIGGLLGIGIAIRVFWKSIKSIFVKESIEDRIDDPTALDEDER